MEFFLDAIFHILIIKYLKLVNIIIFVLHRDCSVSLVLFLILLPNKSLCFEQFPAIWAIFHTISNTLADLFSLDTILQDCTIIVLAEH